MGKTKRVIRPERMNSQGEVTIYIKYTHQSKNAYFSCGEQIHINCWNDKECSVNRNHRGYVKLNLFIEEIQADVDEIRRDLVRANIDPTSQLVKAKYLEAKQPKHVNTSGFFECLDDFISYKETIEKSKISTIKSYKTFRKYLKEFESESKGRITFNSINQKWFSNYTDYLFDTVELGINSCGAQVKLLKSFLNWCVLNEISYNTEFRRFKKPATETNIIALTKEEVDILSCYDFQDEKLEKIRDAFIFSCYTGLRFSDYTRLNKANVINKEIVIHMAKTGEVVRIPLNTKSMEILQKYNFAIDVPSNQKTNENLKKIAKMAGLISIREVKKSSGRKNEIVREPLYAVISTHVGRKTFITSLLNNNVPVQYAMKLSGHKNLSSFSRYMGTSLQELKEYVDVL